MTYVKIPDARRYVYKQFKQHSHLTDLPAIDVLRLKGDIEFKEAVFIFKSTCHLRDILEKPTPMPTASLSIASDRPPTNFLENFYKS